MSLAAEHPNGLSDADYDSLFTHERPVVLAFHGYSGLVHRLTCHREHRNLNVHGDQEEGKISTAFDLHGQNRLNHFDRAIAAVGQLPPTGSRGAHLAQDMPEIRDWAWGTPQ